MKKILILSIILGCISNAQAYGNDYSDQEIDDLIQQIEDRKNAKELKPKNRIPNAPPLNLPKNMD